MKDSFLKNILVNLRAFATVNIRKELNNKAKALADLEVFAANADYDFKQRFLFYSLISYFDANPEEAKQYQKEIAYFRQINHISVFPYPSKIGTTTVDAGYDEGCGLPFVLHNQKKVFFPASFTVDDAIFKYQYLICDERFLGEDDKYAPHQYQSSSVHIENGDVLFDIGAAEGLFALDQIEKVSKAIIVESDSEWIGPLRQTFKPFKDKVVIIQKFISVSDTENTMSLNTLLSMHDSPSMFVKMDIEGNELPSITSAKELLKTKEGIKLSIASYHKQHDYEELKTFFDYIGYHTESSNGYMFIQLYDMPTAPFFRHGILRTKKLS